MRKNFYTHFEIVVKAWDFLFFSPALAIKTLPLPEMFLKPKMLPWTDKMKWPHLCKFGNKCHVFWLWTNTLEQWNKHFCLTDSFFWILMLLYLQNNIIDRCRNEDFSDENIKQAQNYKNLFGMVVMIRCSTVS